MQTTLFLVRCAATEWAEPRRFVGRRDLPLSDDGRAQARATADLLAGVRVTEVLSSPLIRAVETAEAVAAPHRIQVARDPRLIALHAGSWEGKTRDELATDAAWRAHVRDPMQNPIPAGEPLSALRDRVLASVHQALEDNQIGATIVMVTHASAVGVLLAHFLGMSLHNHHQLPVGHGSISILRFDSDLVPPRILAINHGPQLAQILR